MARSLHPSLSRRRTAGSVVVLVLVTVLLAAFMLTKFVQRAGTELLADARAGDQARLRREAYSALEATLAVLADARAVGGRLCSPAQGWGDPLAYAHYEPGDGLRVEVTFDDESGRISLPRTDAATLEALWLLTGVARDEAKRATDALLAWMRPAPEASGRISDLAGYENAALPHHAAGRPLRSLEELAAIAVVRDLLFDEDGQPNERFRQFTGAISRQAFDRINLNGAAPLALAAAGCSATQIEAWQRYLQPEGKPMDGVYLRDVDEAVAVLGTGLPANRFGVEIQMLRVAVAVHDGARVYHLEAVVATNGQVAGGNPPPAEGVSEPKHASAGKKLDYPFQVMELVEDASSLTDAAPLVAAHD